MADWLSLPSHEVVATVRSDSKGNSLIEAYPHVHHGQLAYTVVRDISEEGAFNTAMQMRPFDSIVHVASPYHYQPEDIQRDLIDPAVNGTLGILKAAKEYAPSVRRVVITSSFSAMVHTKNPPMVYTEKHWNPITMEEAKENGVQAYRASKKFAERAAWDFVASSAPNFTIATVNAPLILGPVAPWLESMDSINTSNERVRDLILGKWKQGLPGSVFWHWVDVRDVALAHVRAMTRPEAAGKRFLLCQGKMSNAEIAQIGIEEFPELRSKVPEVLESDEPTTLFDIDATQSKEVLGIEYRELRVTIVDAIKALIRN